MAGEIIYSVFVSSTYEDLRAERAEVQKALLKLHCLPIGMELFGSADEETWDFIKRQIAECDYYVVVIADRYGSTAADGLSYTEKEYDYAREIEKPVLAFLHNDRGNIARDKPFSNVRGVRGARGGDVPIERCQRLKGVRDLSHADIGMERTGMRFFVRPIRSRDLAVAKTRRNRWFADSPLERRRFELSVPPPCQD
jgi:hypothetical protein